MTIDARTATNLRKVLITCFLGLLAGGHYAVASTAYYMGPYVSPSPEEVRADPDPTLEAECFKHLASYEYTRDWKFGSPHWFNSERWGHVLRMDFWRPEGPHLPKTVDRVICWRSKQDGQFTWAVALSHKTSPLRDFAK